MVNVPAACARVDIEFVPWYERNGVHVVIDDVAVVELDGAARPDGD